VEEFADPENHPDKIVTCSLVHATKMTSSTSDDWIY
jgi:hypothetical protein